MGYIINNGIPYGGSDENDVVIVKLPDQKGTSVAPASETIVDTITIPSDGIYYFSAHFTNPQNAHDCYTYMAMKNGNTYTPIEVSGQGAWLRMNGSCVYKCNKGDVLNLVIIHSNANAISINTRFEVVQLKKL